MDTMKKTFLFGCVSIIISAVCFILLALMIIAKHPPIETESRDLFTENELIEWAEQYEFSETIDTTDLQSVNAKIVKKLGFENEGLGVKLSDKYFSRYRGDTVYIIDLTPIVEHNIIKDEMICIGTHHDDNGSFPILCNQKTYNKISSNGWIDDINELRSKKAK